MSEQGNTQPNDDATPREGQGSGDGGKTYTEAEFQAEIDRRVTSAVKTATEKAAAEAAKKLADAEAARLAEQGEYKTLHEKTAAELEELRATLQTKEQRERISAGLREKGLSTFEDVLLSDRSKPEEFVATAAKLQELLKSAVDAEVAQRLDTGRQVKGGEAAPQSTGFVYKTMQPAGA